MWRWRWKKGGGGGGGGDGGGGGGGEKVGVEMEVEVEVEVGGVSARLLLPDRPRAPAHHGAHCFAAVQQHPFISSYYLIVIFIDNKSKIWYVLFCWKFRG